MGGAGGEDGVDDVVGGRLAAWRNQIVAAILLALGLERVNSVDDVENELLYVLARLAMVVQRVRADVHFIVARGVVGPRPLQIHHRIARKEIFHRKRAGICV